MSDIADIRQRWRVIHGDVRAGLASLPEQSAHVCVTSPPYWGLRDYGVDGQIGLEGTPEQYIAAMVEVFRGVRRVLRDDGTCWVNLGDSYAADRGGTSMPAETLAGGVSGRGDKVAKRGRESGGWTPHRDPASHGLKHKDLIGIPWRVAFALQADGWYLRSDIIWHKPNPMPESVTDRPTKGHEYLFLLAKQPRYYYDAAAIAEESLYAGHVATSSADDDARDDSEVRTGKRWTGPVPPTRNRRTVWTIPTQPFSDWATTCHLERVSADVASDGSVRITSPSCPAHAGQPDRVPTAHRGVREVAQLFHSLGIGGRLDRARAVDSVPSGPIHISESAASSSDSPDLPYAQIANGRSTRSRKTDPVPSTSLACTASVQTDTHTDGTSTPRESAGSAERKPVSKTAAGSGAREKGTVAAQTASRTACKCVCSCEHYSVITKETSHFATFPEALVEPCIKAGSPVGGTVLDPFSGSGTTGVVALKQGRSYVGCELNPEYVAMSRRRLGDVSPLLAREVRMTPHTSIVGGEGKAWKLPA